MLRLKIIGEMINFWALLVLGISNSSGGAKKYSHSCISCSIQMLWLAWECYLINIISNGLSMLGA